MLTVALSVPLGYAENLNGKLLDASCSDSHSATTTATGTSKTMDRKARENLSKTCAPSATTKSFAFLDSKGTVYKLDTEGNAKAAAAFQNGSFKADKDGDVHASVSGSIQGDSVKVDSIQGRGEHK
jgi:hypothetical protein